ncbi:MAG: NAD-dependent epimerase/dehydratase family protein [Gemmatimonadales bacterium]
MIGPITRHKTVPLSGAVLGVNPMIAGASFPASTRVAPKRLLILGGTGFIGPHMVDYALRRGHEVTIFNRGRTNTDLFPGVEKLVGDRNDNLDALKGRTWDVVLDNHATIPRWVRQSAQLLKDSVQQYVHVSTISTYDGQAAGATWPDDLEPGSAEEDRLRVDEDSKLAELPDDYDGSERVTGQTYGPFKVMAEAEARAAFPGRATIVRPGLIVGPGDPTDRFTYWPVRVDRGGEVLVPSDGRDSVQVIDARDLTGWIVRLAENGTVGTFNATGPGSRLSMAEMLYGIRAVTSTPVEFTWVDLEFLQRHGVRPWSDMPVWIPRDPIAFVRVDRAISAGLTFRSLADTARDTIDWHATRSDEARASMRAGLEADREAELLEMWHMRE